MTSADATDYRLSQPAWARLVGGLLVLAALLVFVITVVSVLARVSIAWMFPVGFVALLLTGALLWWLRSVPVVRFDADGYRVRLVRGAGVKQASWGEVEDASTTHVDEHPVVVLRLGDGRTTTIPVQVIGADREQFVRDLQAHLQQGQGLRPI